MKANEAPEKIYLDIESNLDDSTWHLTNPNGDSVEYIRKDSFIEKACDYINRHLALLDTENNDYMPKWLEKFKEEMKGE